MARPVATALIDGGHSKEYNFGDLGGGILLTLTGSATNAPILEWEWSILPSDSDNEGGVPAASSLLTGTHGDFTDGKSSVQNPQITIDVPGGYCFSLRARNADGWSLPDLDRDGDHQAIVYVKTEYAAVKQPPANQKRYQDDLNDGLQALEDSLGTLIRETDGPTALSVGAIHDGEFLQRSGGDIVSSNPTDSDAIHGTVSGEISSLAEKVAPVAADIILIEDSESTDDKKFVQLGNLTAIDLNAIHDDVSGEINAITLKASPVAGDKLLIEDSEDGDLKKSVTVGSLPSIIEDNALPLDEVSGFPTNIADRGHVFVNDVGGISELFFQDDQGTPTQITTNGAVVGSGSSGVEVQREFLIVGNGGKIIRRKSDGSYEVITSPTVKNLTTIWGVGESDVYIAGVQVLLKSTDGGDSWVDITADLPITLASTDVGQQIHGYAADAVYVSYEGNGPGYIFKWDGSSWTTLYNDVRNQGIFALDVDNLWQWRNFVQEIRNYDGSLFNLIYSASVGSNNFGRFWDLAPPISG